MFRNLIFFGSIVLIYSCNRTIDDKFPIISKFNASKDQYKRDTISLEGFSLEGGELIVYHKKSDTLVLDFFLYGETGKLNYTYFTDKNFEYNVCNKKRLYVQWAHYKWKNKNWFNHLFRRDQT